MPGPAARAGAAGRWARPRRLHPASVVLGVNLRQLLQAVVFPLFATLAAGGIFAIAIIGTAVLVGLVMRILAWQRFTFSFDGEVLRVEEGVVSRSARSLDVARVQQVEIDRGPVQRLLGLAALRVETAGSSSEVEVDLRVVTEDEAVALRQAIREGKARKTGSAPADGGDPAGAEAAAEPAEPARQELLAVPLAHVVLAAVTGGRLLVFPAVIVGALQFAGDVFGQFLDDALERLVENGTQGMPGWRDLTLQAGLLVGAGVLLLSVVAAVVVGILQDANYRVSRVGDDLHVRRGLLSTRESVVPIRRVQLVEIQRNWLRRLLGYGNVRVHSAGGSGDADRRVTVPLLPDGRVDDFLREVLPGVPGVPALRAHPKQARRRVVFRWLRPPLVLAAVVWAWNPIPFTPFDLPDAARYGVVALLLLAVLLGIVEHRNLGHALTERIVVSRRGALSITTGVAPVVKVQAASRSANWFQRRLGLTTVDAHVAGPGGDLEVLDAGEADGERLYRALVRHAADPDPVGPSVEEVPAGA
ncbi:PH domain-containing protein [Egicoccus sp. AB-alg2]|uniref:PH domain-containing protein n=1 Tax=Egicoccus sp. AB-alg2 TaxID=3242693 RepID=UPI00359DB245